MMLLSTAAKATHGQFYGADVSFSSVGTDSRAIQNNQLFIALKGEHFDGHNFVQSALEQGAAAVMLSTAMENISPALQVADTRLGLGQLAAYWRSTLNIPLVAITGSSGKTTVKEMLASILKAAAGHDEAVLATQGNLNNDIGMPLTLLKLNAQHQYAVIEMGMNHLGEISYLTNLAKPSVALVNNAGTAHIGELGSVEAIARAKGEIFEGLADDGTAIINADDDFAPFWRSLIGNKKILSFGINNTADVNAHYQLKDGASSLHVKTPKGEFAVELPAAGLHNVLNALAATAAAVALDVHLEKIALGLSQFAGVKGRLQQKLGLNGALVIDDTYNANPASMKAAIDVLALRAGKKIMVMGDMGELGIDASKMHAEIGAYAKQAGIGQFYALGEHSLKAVQAFGAGAIHYVTLQDLADALKTHMTNDATVLVKGSRFMAMERVVNLIVDTKAKPNTTTHQGDAHVA